MAINRLKGVANNLGDSFVSSSNTEFLSYVKSLPQKARVFEIDLLREAITSKDVPDAVRGAVHKYRAWFVGELSRLNIKLSEIESVKLKIECEPGRNFGIAYICNTVIKAKGKEYASKITSSWA